MQSKKHWYLVAQRAGARIFEQDGVKPDLRLVRSFENPEGMLRDGELVSDKRGAADRSTGPGHTPMGGDLSARIEVLRKFAHELSDFLEAQAEQEAFSSITLVAEPHVLGELKKAIGHMTSSRMRDPLIKDLVNIPDNDMAAHLQNILCAREVIQS